MRDMRSHLPFEVWALVAGSFAVAVGYGVVAPVIPQFALEFGVSNLAASAIVSAMALMRFVSAPLAGRLVNRIGEKRTYTIGILVIALSTGACALAADYPQLLVLRALGGIGSAMYTIAATGLLIRLSPASARGRVASLNASGFFAGMILGPVIGALVAPLGVRAPFLFYFCMLIVAAAVVQIALRRSRLAASGPGRGRAGEEPMRLAEALRLPQYRAQLVSVFAFDWASFGVRVSVGPLFVIAAYDGGAELAAWVLAAYAVGNALFILPAGRWSDSVGRRPLLVGGMLGTSLAYALFPAAPSIGWALAAMFAAGVGAALVNPGQQAVLADVVGRRSGGQVVAVSSMLGDLGAVAGPLVAGALVDAAGFGWSFAVTGGLLALSALVWAVVPMARPAGEGRGA